MLLFFDVQDITFSLAEHHQILLSPILQPVQAFWIAAQPSAVSVVPPSFVLSVNLPRVYEP